METALSETKAHTSVPVQITVLRARDLKGAKSDSPVTYVRSEFNNVLLGDSPKLEAAASQPTEYDFTASFDIGPDGPHGLDDVAQKPVLLTVFEVLPKEKKQKEEKMAVLGQAAVDLLPLLKGCCSYKVTLPLHPVTGAPPETAHPEHKPSLEVAVSVPEPLLSEGQISDGNQLTVTVEAAYSVPESWNTTGPQYNYAVGLQIPAAGEKPVLFSNGSLKAGGEMEPVPRQKKWPVSGIAAPGAQNIPESFIVGGPYEEEGGEMNRTEDKEFRTEAETLRKRVTWDMERRCYLEPSTLTSLQKRIAECRYWPVEIMRVPVTSTTKAKTTKTDKGEEDLQISFHGVAYVNMVPLLYPGVTRLRGAFRIHPYQDSEVLEKTKCQVSVLREVARQSSLGSRFGNAPAASPHARQAPSRTSKEDKPGRDTGRRMSAVLKPSDLPRDGDSTPPAITQSIIQNVEGQQYSEAGTYIVLELCLEKPLVPKRSAEELDIKVKELLPPRPQLPRRSAGAQKAVADYQSQVSSITNSILEEYFELFGQRVAEGQELDRQALEEQKCQLNYELNCSGKYFAFKEQLKHTVVKIVREKYLKTTAFEDREKLQAFLGELYVFLVDQMHLTLNKTLFDDREEPPPPPMTDPEKLRCFAREAELNEDYQLAEMYYQERLVRDRQCLDHWVDYGKFQMLTGNYLKAQECFFEALNLNRSHPPSLLLSGIIAVLLGNYGNAEVLFEDATCLHPTSVLAWTMLGLFYELQGNDIRMEMAFSEAHKLRQAQAGQEKPPATSDTGAPHGEAASVGEIGDRGRVADGPAAEPSTGSIFMEAALFLARANATQFVQRSLAHELLSPDGGPSCRYHLLRAQTHLLRKELDEANKNLEEASKMDHQNPDVWAFTGHLRLLSGDKREARNCYERTLSLVSDASEMQPVYLRLGSIYLEEGENEKAKNTYLTACKRSPTCLTWLGAGIACYRLGNMEEAEDALSEANALNNANAEVWGYLALICLKAGRQVEAEQCYKYTRKLNLQNPALLDEIHRIQEEVGFGDPSF
ncbi:cilia- and flagella-associated protein 70 [Spea bombifrons]|uniref:cilia- and flagella-associated protein 70 n=1 Tax=Spea bombifrons TaxID=233779 RepID=UPI002349840A|nr:cilia- and flagella-associated protein 70 [Spea bombifrons]XP_053327862.1 cilia- and flagella-associated protein 70 [Spea bombifrons]